MLHRSIVPSPKAALSLQEVLQLTDIYLENAHKVTSNNVTLVLCHNAEVALSQVKSTSKKSSSSDPEEQAMCQKMATAYYNLAKLLENLGHQDEAETFYKKCKKLGGHVPEPDQFATSSPSIGIVGSNKSTRVDVPPTHTDLTRASTSRQLAQSTSAKVPSTIFSRDLQPPALDFRPPELDSRLNDTPQLACCLALLQISHETNEVVAPLARNWLQLVKDEPDEHERLKLLATDIIRTFKRDELKDAKAVTEVVYLAPVLDRDDFRYLLKEFHMGIEHSTLLDVHQLDGLAQLIQGADTTYLDADDLVKVLDLLSIRLQRTHKQSPQHLHQLTFAVSNVLDAMADAEVKGLDREKIHEPLLSYLDGLRGSSDPYLVYQAAYAYQALLCVPDNETLWQATLRRTGKVVKGISGLVSAVKGLDLNGFMEGLGSIQQGLAGVSDMVQVVKGAYEGAASLAEGGQGFLEGLKAGLSFNRKCAWYPALRGADTMIQAGQLAEFRRLICEAPCRRDMAFQWGVCQRLGDIAANPQWDLEARQGAVAFLAEIYKDDIEWGQQVAVKQWILNILMQLSSRSGGDIQYAECILNELRNNGDASKRSLYRLCRENGSGLHPLKIGSTGIGSPSLLDRVQERPDVEGNLRQLRRQRLKERGSSVYIPSQAKANLQSRDEAGFSLMDKVNDFIAGDRKVFLLLGDSGAGKSTFNKELECQLWQRYRKKTGAIPLHINLPAIDKPENDMIAKQLRKFEFTEPQIRELKLHRSFILICDGYDESQQAHNLYTSNRMNQPGEWSVKMVISCRSEYLGIDYRDRFQPGDRNQRPDSSLFQEAVIVPFSLGQIQEYIDQYVSVKRPLWEAGEYKRVLDLIPSLKELMRNPFLMSLSLEVLPRIVDPGQDLSATHITRVALYDQFIEHWLERGKRRLGEKNLSPQSRAAFESLIDEGFTRNGIVYLKNLSRAIYKEQGGQPLVSFSRYKDEDSWKAEFFSREEEKQLLREASPLIRNGNQHRFIHRSLLEYGVALAVFDPQDWEDKPTSQSALVRRGSTSSVLSFMEPDPTGQVVATLQQDPILDSPLAWRNFVNEPSVLQFMEERAQQEPLFKQLLLNCIEQSKADKKWRTAAANAITILVRIGEQFNCADLRGIQVPGADISYGVFESAQLQEADLRHVDLRGAWLRGADLSETRMTGAQFGELPYLGQESEARLCAFSSDGKSLSVVLIDGTIKVYSTPSWDIVWTMRDQGARVTSIVYSPRFNQLASACEDSRVRLWNTDKGTLDHTLCGHGGCVNSVAYSPAGDQVASASKDKSVRIWDVKLGHCIHTFTGHTGWVLCVLYSPRGDLLVSGGRDSKIRLWIVGAKECLVVLSGHSGPVSSVAFAPQGHQLASASKDGTVRLWDVATGQCHHTMTNQNMEHPCVVYSPKGDHLVSTGRDSAIQLWDANSGVCLHRLPGHSGAVTRITYASNGELIASSSYDKTVRLWDPETGICYQTLTGHSGRVNNATFGPDGGQVVSISDDKTVRLWDIRAGTSRHVTRGRSGAVWSIKCSPKGGQFVIGSVDKTVQLWDIKAGLCTTMVGHRKGVGSVAISPQADFIVSASDDTTVIIWNATTGDCHCTLMGHTDCVNCVAFSPIGRQIASCGDDYTVRLWDTETKECCHVLKGHYKRIWRVVFSPKGEMIASASQDCTVRLWDTTTGDCQHIIIGHSTQVYSIAYSPDGRQIAFSSTDGSIRLWDIESGTSLQKLTGHNGEVNGIVYSPRGDLVVSASEDMTLRVWDVVSGQCRVVIEDMQYSAIDIDWMSRLDANYLVAGCKDGAVVVWKLIDGGDHYQLRLHWRKTVGGLSVENATIQDVHGLSQLNKQLLKQRGALGEPASRLRDAGNRVIRMASVLSNLRVPSNTAVVDSRPNVPVDRAAQRQSGQQVQQGKEPEVRDIVAAFIKALKDTREEDRSIIGLDS